MDTGTMDPRLQVLFRDYAVNHRDAMNVRLHKIAIPLIVFHIIAMLSWLPLCRLPGTTGHLSVAHLAYVGAVLWYLSLDRHLGLIMAALFALCFPLAAVTPPALVVLIAVIGWGVQLTGHSVWEKQQPAFLRNLVHALVGPLYFVATSLGRWPVRPRAI